MKNIKQFYKNIYSQNGEDGIIEYLFEKLDIKSGYVVEFGAWDGILYSNTYNLWKDGRFNAVLIEGEKDRFNTLRENIDKCTESKTVIAINRFVQQRGIGCLSYILEQHNIGHKEIVLLSIDVDGLDYGIWENYFAGQKPVPIVIIEINTGLGPDISKYTEESGASFTAMIKLAAHKGYTLVDHCGNCIFVRSDLVHKIYPEKIPDPYSLFSTTQYESGFVWWKE